MRNCGVQSDNSAVIVPIRFRDRNGNLHDENSNLADDESSHDSTLESVTSQETLTEGDDVTVLSPCSQFVLDPHRTLSVSGDLHFFPFFRAV